MKIEANERISQKDESVKATVISDGWLEASHGVPRRETNETVGENADDELIDDWID
jgi:hypothetical protein